MAELAGSTAVCANTERSNDGMTAADPQPAPPQPRPFPRRWRGLSLSLAVHAAVAYAMARVPWAASELPLPPLPAQEVIWLAGLPAPKEPALEPDERLATAAPPLAPAPAVEPAARADQPPPSRAPAPRARSAPRPPEPPAPAPAAPEAVAGADVSQGGATLPKVDWNKERLDAVRDVLERRATERQYLTFSLDDVVKEPEPAEPVLPPLVVDHCVIVKNRLQRFAALMTGRCVREARGDLFALLKPGYLRSHPVCLETRPEAPGSLLSDGTVISTVKCELVANEDEE
jgi:hypothetical protein